MSNNRDDFPIKVKQLLAERVGLSCSNPGCKCPTSGPHSDVNKRISVGEAAHIKAAAAGGPRYDPNMTDEERRSVINGIWLCNKCHTIIDSDETRYTVDILNKWKELAEEERAVELRSSPENLVENNDVKIIKFFAKCFNRPAFEDPVEQEGCMEDLEQAIQDTMLALRTGMLRDRQGSMIKEGEGITLLKDAQWREKVELIIDILRTIDKRLKVARKDGIYHKNGDSTHSYYCFNDRELQRWFDDSRNEIIKIFSSICREAGLPELRGIRMRRYYPPY